MTTISPPTGTSDTDKSASAILQDTLAQYGLAGLGSTVWNWYLNGKTIDQILLDLRNTPEYKARFPAMDALAKSGHAITESQYIQYETNATQLMQAAGLPPGFYDQPDDFTKFLTNNVALPELQSRIDLAKTAAYNSPPETLQALQDFYGIQGRAGSLMGDLTSYYLDPTRALPVIQKQFLAAQDAGDAARSGFGAINQGQAENLASLGVSDAQARAGFTNLSQLHEVLGVLPGEAGAGIGTDQALAAQFGDSAAAQQAIKDRQAARLAQFQGGGQFAAGQTGNVGVGGSQP